jgi:hypothetical protein
MLLPIFENNRRSAGAYAKYIGEHQSMLQKPGLTKAQREKRVRRALPRRVWGHHIVKRALLGSSRSSSRKFAGARR